MPIPENKTCTAQQYLDQLLSPATLRTTAEEGNQERRKPGDWMTPRAEGPTIQAFQGHRAMASPRSMQPPPKEGRRESNKARGRGAGRGGSGGAKRPRKVEANSAGTHTQTSHQPRCEGQWPVTLTAITKKYKQTA